MRTFACETPLMSFACPVEDFGELVRQINSEYKFRVSGTPLCDPETGGPFAIAKDENEVFLQWKNPSPSGTIICTTLDGKEMLRTEIPSGQQTFRIDTSNFPSGIYSLRFLGNADVQSLRFVKM